MPSKTNMDMQAQPPRPKIVKRVDPQRAAQYALHVQESGWKGGAMAVLRLLAAHENAWPFMQPFQGSDVEMRAYHAVVKRPMDLPLVMDRLTNGTYTRGGRKDFLRDIRSVFANAMLFHTKEDQRYQMAQELSDKFEDEWAAVMSLIEKPEDTAQGDDEGGEHGSNMDASMDFAMPRPIEPGANWRKDCEHALERLKQHPSSWAFLEAMEPQAEASVAAATRPKDLASVNRKLENGQYTNPDVFAEDIRSVFKQAASAFGTEGEKSDMAKIAEAMLKEFEQDWRALQGQWATEGRMNAVAAVHGGGIGLLTDEWRVERKDLPWKVLCEHVIEDLGRHKDAASFEKALTKLRARTGEYRHPAEFAREARAAFIYASSCGNEEVKAKTVDMLAGLDQALAKHLAGDDVITLAAANQAFRAPMRGPNGEPPPRWFSECENVLRNLLTSPSSWPCLRCVDLSAPGSWRTLDRIPRPMDLTAVRALLTCGHYVNAATFIADVRLSFSNALRACGKEGDEGAMIENLLAIASRSAIFRDAMDRTEADAMAKQYMRDAKKTPEEVRKVYLLFLCVCACVVCLCFSKQYMHDAKRLLGR
jgi:hypothetical protein